MNDGAVRAAIQAGATDLDALARLCRAGSGCGGCVPTLEQLLAAASADLDQARRRIDAA